MARKAAERNEKKGVVIDNAEREQAKTRRNKLVNPSYDEVEAALKAVKICDGCVGENIKRKNAEGKCILCNGSGLMRDKDERRWAAVFVLERADPAPKSVEMIVDDHRDKEQLMKEVEALDPTVADEMLEKLGIQVRERNPNNGDGTGK